MVNNAGNPMDEVRQPEQASPDWQLLTALGKEHHKLKPGYVDVSQITAQERLQLINAGSDEERNRIVQLIKDSGRVLKGKERSDDDF